MPSFAAAMRYRDVAAASEWLSAAFGFQQHLVVTGEDGAVHYVQLVFGDAMFMLAPVQNGAIDRFMKQPDEIGGAETQSCYLVVDDADAHYARAKAAGAAIILDIADDDTGGRVYSCRDPEGHIWSFGTHDPWRGQRTAGGFALADAGGSRAARRSVAVLAFLVAIAATAAVTAGFYGAFREPETLSLATAHPAPEAIAKEAEERATRSMQERLGAEQRAREAAEREVLTAREQLVRERTAKVTAERALEQVSKRLAEEKIAKEVADSAAQDARRALATARTARHDDGAERAAAAELRQQLERERAAREIAERSVEQAKLLASEDRNSKEAAERAVDNLRAQLDSGRAEQAAAEQSVEQLRQQLVEQQSARQAAEQAAKEARDQLNREQSAKNAAWRAAAQLRRQLSQVQATSAPATDVPADAQAEAETPAPAAKAVRAKPKGKQKTKAQVEQ